MAFTIKEFRDLIRLLEAHPEWRTELRRLVLTEELLALPEIMRGLVAKVDALVEAQRRHYEEFAAHRQEFLVYRAETDRRFAELREEVAAARAEADRRFAELAEAQRRHYEEFAAHRQEFMAYRAETDRRFAELAEAQRRTEEAVGILAAAQRRTDERVERLEAAVEGLRSEIGRLTRVVGATAEEGAESVLRVVLPRKGYRLLAEPRFVGWDGEVDVVVPAEKDGQVVWVVVEAKVRQSWRAIEDWANRMRSESFRRSLAIAGVEGPYLVYAFGIRVDKGAEEAARKFGIGLLTAGGERVPPGELLPPG